MPLVFAALTPHPPIIVPEVGGAETKKVKKTILAMEKLAEDLAKSDPDTLIVISPHGLVYPDRFNVCGMENLRGDLTNFNTPQVSFKFKNDLDFAKVLDETANKEGIETLLYDNRVDFYELDHGVIVPLYFLTKKLEHSVKVVPIAYSLLSRASHVSFGQAISDVINNLDKSEEKRVAIIASGDLSHRLIFQAPAGFSPVGEKFDQKLISLLKQKKTAEILDLDEDFVEEAGECGYRSILILLGALDEERYTPEILSYEGPFGVGYLVANFKLKPSSDQDCGGRSE